ncbi:hypothetical protein JCM16303_002734 [Sporobolomyces ruberrimus]
MSMTSLSQLHSLKRAQLQALCKENSLKANGKNDDLIQSLAQHFQLTRQEPQEDSQSSEQTAQTNVTAKKNVKTKAKASAEKVVAREQPTEKESSVATNINAAELAVPPHVQALLDSLVSDVATLKEELALSRTAVTELEKIWTYVDSELEACAHGTAYALRQEDRQLEVRIGTQFARVAFDISGLRTNEAGAKIERQVLETRIGRLEERVDRFEKAQLVENEDLDKECSAGRERIQRYVDTCLDRIEERLDNLEGKKLVFGPTGSPQTEEEEEEDLAPAREESAHALDSDQHVESVEPASPTLSDAPPTRSLVAFDSPAGSPIPQIEPTHPHAPFASASSQRPNPLKLVPTSQSASTVVHQPVSALPPHMAAPASRQSLRSPRASTTASEPRPGSHLTPPPKESLGKRSRESDASNLSIGLERVISPSRYLPQGTLLSRFFAAADSNSAKKEDGHSTKKMRMSVAAESEPANDTPDHDDIASSDEGQEDDSDDEEEEEDDEEEEDPEHEDSNDSVRDYLMPTKTGDSPATTLRPTSTVSTSDPSFFSAPVSPARPSTPGRRSIATVNENKFPTPNMSNANVPRKSLPMTALPFPLVSPFNNNNTATTKTRPTAGGSSFGTPSTTTAFGNLSNQHFTTVLKNTSKSATKPSTMKRVLPPRTPPASRTLFGTERFPFSDGGFEDGEEGFATAEEDNHHDSTGTEHAWSKFGGGAFSRV